MLELTVVQAENFDEENNMFVPAKSFVLQLEHSLFSLAKWESREEKPFLGNEKKSTDEVLRYIRDMLVTPGITDQELSLLSSDNLKSINDYINAKMTATTFSELQQRMSPLRKEIVTAEIMYHWMVALSIPFETQHWHLNRLITLVKVCNEKNKPAGKKRKMTRNMAAERAALNQQRLAAHGTTG